MPASRFGLGLTLLALLYGTPAHAHLLAGRRPLDYFVAKADALVIAHVTQGTRRNSGDPYNAAVARARITRCLSSLCPRGVITVMAMDEHAAELATDTRYFLALVRDHGPLASKRGIVWRLLQNGLEARPLELGELQILESLVARYLHLRNLPASERERTYLHTLLDQLDAPLALYREDALQSLLRFPPDRTDVTAKRRILERVASAGDSPGVQIGILLLANLWDEAALRQKLATLQLNRLDPYVLARAIEVLGQGSQSERALPCQYLGHPFAEVRAAAVGSCRPVTGDWLPHVLEALDDPSFIVRTAARERLRRHPESRPAVVRWFTGREPWWKRPLYRFGPEPTRVREVYGR